MDGSLQKTCLTTGALPACQQCGARRRGESGGESRFPVVPFVTCGSLVGTVGTYVPSKTTCMYGCMYCTWVPNPAAAQQAQVLNKRQPQHHPRLAISKTRQKYVSRPSTARKRLRGRLTPSIDAMYTATPRNVHGVSYSPRTNPQPCTGTD